MLTLHEMYIFREVSRKKELPLRLKEKGHVESCLVYYYYDFAIDFTTLGRIPRVLSITVVSKDFAESCLFDYV